LAIGAVDFATIRDYAAHVTGSLPHNPVLQDAHAFARALLERWGWKDLENAWDQNTEGCLWALMDMDLQQHLPIPEAAMILRHAQPVQGQHPFMPLIQDKAPLPYEWSGQPGVLAPMLTERLSLCLARHGHHWLAASREPIMAHLADSPDDANPIHADLYLRADWAKMAHCAETLLARAAAWELIPRRNADDVQSAWLPPLRTLGRLGMLEIQFHVKDNHTRFHGHLARSARTTAPTEAQSP